MHKYSEDMWPVIQYPESWEANTKKRSTSLSRLRSTRPSRRDTRICVKLALQVLCCPLPFGCTMYTRLLCVGSRRLALLEMEE